MRLYVRACTGREATRGRVSPHASSRDAFFPFFSAASLSSAASIWSRTFSAQDRPESPPHSRNATYPFAFHGSAFLSAGTSLFCSLLAKNPTICLMTSGLTVSRFFRFTARCTPDPMPSSAACAGVNPPRFDGLAFWRSSRPFSAAAATPFGGLKSMWSYFFGAAARRSMCRSPATRDTPDRASRTASVSAAGSDASEGSLRSASRASGAMRPRCSARRANSAMRALLSTGGRCRALDSSSASRADRPRTTSTNRARWSGVSTFTGVGSVRPCSRRSATRCAGFPRSSRSR